jgi:hypothetical protein
MDEGKGGLRLFSRRVWNLVMELSRTTYGEVADALVEECNREASAGRGDATALEERNVRRRVYDALNVLIALGVIEKTRKQILWRGLPSGSAAEVPAAEAAYEASRVALVEKRRAVRDLCHQQLALRRLVQRNQQTEAANCAKGLFTDGEGGAPGRPPDVLHLPLVTVSSPSPNVTLESQTPAHDVAAWSESSLTFDAPFVVHYETDLLRHLSFHEMGGAKLRALVPPHLQRYLLHPIDEPPLGGAGSMRAGAGTGEGEEEADGAWDGEYEVSPGWDIAGAAMRSAAAEANAALVALAAASIPPGLPSAAPQLPAIALGEGEGGASLPSLPSTAAADVVTRLLGAVGLSNLPPFWGAHRASALAAGRVPVPGLHAGADPFALLALAEGAHAALGGLVGYRGSYAPAESIVTAVSGAASAVVGGVPVEVTSLLTALLMAAGGRLTGDAAVRKILSDAVAARVAAWEARKRAGSDLLRAYAPRLGQSGSAAGSEARAALTRVFQTETAAFNAASESEWSALEGSRRAVMVAEAELVGQAIALLAAGWQPTSASLSAASYDFTAAAAHSAAVNARAGPLHGTGRPYLLLPAHPHAGPSVVPDALATSAGLSDLLHKALAGGGGVDAASTAAAPRPADVLRQLHVLVTAQDGLGAGRPLSQGHAR